MPQNENKIYDEFYETVNMMPSELEDWLKTEESKSVGKDSGDGESVGHKSGRRIIQIKNKTKDDISENDLDHMEKVIGYINRHKAQKPDGKLRDTDWAYSLKNWGFDPCKEFDCD